MTKKEDQNYQIERGNTDICIPSFLCSKNSLRSFLDCRLKSAAT